MKALTRRFLIAAGLAWTASLPAEAPLPKRIHGLLGIPYRDDAGLDEHGRWATFSHPEAVSERPGLNCSGFLVAAARHLLGYHGSLAEAGRDRLGDSGPRAEAGLDWDFGWDLVLNLSDGHVRSWVLPAGDHLAPGGTGHTLAGFKVWDSQAWARLATRWRPDRVYLATLQRGSGLHLRHHHVALLLKEAAGGLWFYQTLPQGRVHRLALDTSEGMARLRTMFGPGERILVLEVQP
jgi:hypothetical protein